MLREVLKCHTQLEANYVIEFDFCFLGLCRIQTPKSPGVFQTNAIAFVKGIEIFSISPLGI